MRNYEPLPVQRYNYSDTTKLTNSFEEVLGKGGYGGVYKAKRPNERPIAAKVLMQTKDNGKEFINKVASISKTSHVNLITLLGFCFERKKLVIIYSLVLFYMSFFIF